MFPCFLFLAGLFSAFGLCFLTKNTNATCRRLFEPAATSIYLTKHFIFRQMQPLTPFTRAQYATIHYTKI